MAHNKGYKIMIILELICMFILITTMISVIVVSYGKQQEKYHRRHREWMKENLKKDRG